MSFNKYNKYKCQAIKTELAYKQYELSNVNIKGIKGLKEFKDLIKDIHHLLHEIYSLECDGGEYVYQGEPKLKKTSTTLKLNRQHDRNKLFKAVIGFNLPPKKRKSFRK